MKLVRLATLGLLAATAAMALPQSGYAQAKGQSVTIALPTDPNYLDGCSISSRQIGIVLRQNVIETLTVLNPENSQPMPRLATSWERLNDKTWRFKLREGVKFHDGADFNAEAVATALKRHFNSNIACLDRTKIKNVEISTKVVDPHTIDITTEPAQVLLPVLFNFVGMTAPSTDYNSLVREPVGTGPYAFKSWNSDGDITLERFTGYWGEKPAIDKVTYVVRPESALRAAMVKLGEADIGVDIAHQDATDPKMDFSFFNTETTRVRIVMVEPPLTDIRVRKALNLAFDRDALIGTILDKGVLKSTQFFLPNINGYNPDLKPWPYDPAQAKKLLAEAKADGVPVGKELRLIGRIGFFTNQEEMLQAMAQMWNAVGFNIKVEMMEKSQWLALVNRPYPPERHAMLIQEQHDNGNGDAVFTMPFKYRTGGQQSDMSIPALDKILDEAALSTGEKRTKLYQEANRIVAEEVIPAVPQYHMVAFMRVGPRLVFKPDSTCNGQLELSKIAFKK